MWTSLLYHLGNLLFNVQSEAFPKKTGWEGGGGLQVPLTLLPLALSEAERRLGSRSARGRAAELGPFLLPRHRRLAPPSICSFGTYSCNDQKQSLIKLQRILARNQRQGVLGEFTCSCLWMSLRRLVCLLFLLFIWMLVCGRWV